MTASEGQRNRDWIIDTAAIGLGAFLMFLIQPLVGKIVTPQYGGVSQVWSVCLMFFQMVLLLGYAFTFWVSHLSLKKQAIIYIGTLLMSALLIQTQLGSAWEPPSDGDPVFHLLKNLFLHVALPCAVLSTTSTMLQNWYGITRKSSPYHMYSISNFGSMLALLSYPILIEPVMTVGHTIQGLIWGYWVLSVLIIFCSIRVFCSKQANEPYEQVPSPPPSKDMFWWLSLSACGTILLISVTHHLSTDVAPVPMLWLPPLVVYLLTFILTFSHEKVYYRQFYIYASQIAILLIPIITKLKLALPVVIGLQLLFLFFLCMVCHGEIYRRKPQTKYLPGFYLTIAAGGALGGVIVNLIAPQIFDSYTEFPLILLGIGIVTLYFIVTDRLLLFKIPIINNSYLALISAAVLFIYYMFFAVPKANMMLAERNFYGATAVEFIEDFNSLMLTHGQTYHGGMLRNKDTQEYQTTPTLYYAETSGVGIVHGFMRERRQEQPLKVGIIGLGVGTVATYGQPGDEITFFEIDPKIKDIAYQHFYFLQKTSAKVEILLGDGRLSLAKLAPQQYDILIIDAFNSDAVPVHLLTREAFGIYLSHLKPDGVLMLHITNKYLKLHNVVSNLALDAGYQGVSISDKKPLPHGAPSVYGVIFKDPWLLSHLEQSGFKERYPGASVQPMTSHPNVGVWTDNYSNLFSIMIHQR